MEAQVQTKTADPAGVRGGGQDAAVERRLACLRALEQKVLWLSTWMIHHANHVRPNRDGLKVGGHQASCASLATLMTALYFDILRPHDRVAVKPHASPIFHAIQYLLGRQNRAMLERFRAYGGAQSYPSRTKDGDDVDFSTGSVGLGVAITLFAALVQDLEVFRNRHRVPPGEEFEPFAGLEPAAEELRAFLAQVPFAAPATRLCSPPLLDMPQQWPAIAAARMSTQEGFGRLLGELARQPEGSFVDRIVTTSPDVTVSTNLGAWVNRRGVFDRPPRAESPQDRPTLPARRQTLEARIHKLRNFALLLG